MFAKRILYRFSFATVLVLLLASVAMAAVGAQNAAPCDSTLDYASAAMTAYDVGEYETALPALHCATLRDLQNIDLHAAYLQAALRTGRLTTADAASRYIETLAVERFDDIIDQMEAALEVNPADEGAAVVLTFARYPIQGSDIARIQSINPDNVLALMYTGRKAVYQDNNPEAARAAFGRALALAGDDPEILVAVAANYLNGLNDTEGALTLIEHAITIDSTFAASYYARGIYNVMTGDADAAIADYTRAIELDAYDYTISSARAALLSAKGEHAAALEDFRYVLSVNPASPTALASIVDISLITENAEDRVLAADSFLNARAEVVNINALLTEAQPMTVSITGGRMVQVAVVLQARREVMISAVAADPTSLDPLMMVVDPVGGAVAYNDDVDVEGGDYSAVVSLTPAESGVYLILGTHSGGGAEGEMTLTMTHME